MESDIERYIIRRFAAADRARVEAAIERVYEHAGAAGARVARCVLFLSLGDVDAVDRHAEHARVDWRDVVWWAEYDGGERQLRDFTRPFDAT
jgi:hypothetical protein